MTDVKEFTNMAAQGDVLFIRIDELPKDAVEVKAENGAYIVAHSETGHHHIVKERPEVKMYQDASDPMTAYLQVLSVDTLVEHMRSFDTHKTLKFKLPGIFKIRRQREAAPEGWRRAAD